MSSFFSGKNIDRHVWMALRTGYVSIEGSEVCLNFSGYAPPPPRWGILRGQGGDWYFSLNACGMQLEMEQ